MGNVHSKTYFPSPVSNDGSEVSEFDSSHEEQALDEALMESFPASDPVAVSFAYVANRIKLAGQSSEDLL